MSEGVFRVEPDGTLAVDKRNGKQAATLGEALSKFAEPLHATKFQSHYRVTAASIWKGRRQELSLEDITHTLEAYCETEVPASLLADVTLWSDQIDRLWLETEQGRLVLRSHNSLLIAAVQRHHILRRFVKQKIATNALELRAEMESDLIQAFDDAQYPVLDRRQEGAAPTPLRVGSGTASARRRRRRSSGHSPRAAGRPDLTTLMRSSHSSVQTDDLYDLFRRPLANRCPATTKSGRQCKNRVRPPDVYCRVHRPIESFNSADDLSSFGDDSFKYLVEAGLISSEQMAWFRVGISVGIGLSTWLLHTLFMWVGAGWLGLPLASWYTVPIAFVLASWLVSLPVSGGSLGAVLLLILVSLLSIVLDFFNKEGLILNICSVLIPFVLPLYLLYRYSLSGWWGLLFVPVGLLVGWVFYHVLDDSPE